MGADRLSHGAGLSCRGLRRARRISERIADQSRGARRGVAVSGAASATRRAAPRRQLGQDQDRLRSPAAIDPPYAVCGRQKVVRRSEEHTSELQSLMRISYAVFCLKKTNKRKKNIT